MELASKNHVTVKVEVIHSPHHSEPERLFYIYFITIKNLGRNPVQILRRHWDIRAANGDLQTVDAEGVIGQTPVIEPGQEFVYNSGVPIVKAPGQMSGFYTMRSLELRDDGQEEQFVVEIPVFVLPHPEGQEVPDAPSPVPSSRLVN